MVLCVPTARLEVVNVAVPPLNVPVPSVVEPSLNVTVPLGLPEPVLVTVAVKITDWPNTDPLGKELSVVVVAVAVGLVVTVCVSAPEVLVRKLLSPAYVAVMV